MSETMVLGIVGSPRRGANTETLIDQLLKGAEKAGAATEKLILGEMNIQPCRACNVCQKTGKCVIDDDFASALEKMKRSRVWVLGTPVYWWGPTAQMKAFIDRWYGVDRALFKGKGVILAVSSGGGSSYARLTVEMLESIVPYLGMKHIATLQAPGASGPESVKRNTALMNKARTTGNKAVRET
ncbi:flavodoxin family protein [Candidatus Bathyarchaeota archaeon]|nr:flavodoxin family protein [Candidatus Bathyarchaeota archaeon]